MLPNGIEPTDVEGIERAAWLAGRIVLRHRDNVEDAVGPVLGSSASGTMWLGATTVQQEPKGHCRHHWKKNLCDSGPHRTTSSTNFTLRISRDVSVPLRCMRSL